MNVHPVTDIGVRVAIGAVIPKRSELRPLPTQIVEIIPELKGYLFLETRNDLVIVDPDNLEIVDIIPL